MLEWSFKDVLSKLMTMTNSEKQSGEFTEELKYINFFKYSPKVSFFTSLVFMAVVVNLCILVFNFPLWSAIFIMLLSDMLFTFMESLFISYKIKKHKKIVSNKEKLGNKIESLKGILEKTKRERRSLRDRIFDGGILERSFLEGKLDGEIDKLTFFISKLEEKYSELEDEDEKNIEIIESMVDTRESKAIAEYRKTIKDIEKEVDTWVRLKTKYRELIEITIETSKELIDEVEKNPSAHSIVSSNFNIYLLEIVHTIKHVSSISSKEDRDIYNEKIHTLVEEYISYIEGLKEKAMKFNFQDIDVTINTLLSDIKDKKEMM